MRSLFNRDKNGIFFPSAARSRGATGAATIRLSLPSAAHPKRHRWRLCKDLCTSCSPSHHRGHSEQGVFNLILVCEFGGAPYLY
ncbi:hypothetical protein CYMTET_18623 [Cymbomonas tetramitiformis]|uniref:Uncharacterized protein n=1 Tax=Cymbomonas tetramitiformis TaxID=36881 RepID=A0AAE0G862_9CHLO|nr:hypothetical protein CYMTET_18623 [Cymbomonas tetramitiformis]